MSMWKYVLERIVLIFFTALIILCLTYILLQSLPVEKPGGTYLTQLSYWRDQVDLGYWFEVTDKAQITLGHYNIHITDGLGQDAYFSQYPIMVRFWNWFVNVFTKWDWGTSIAVSQNKSAMEIEMGYLPVSMKLNIWAILISIPSGIGLGILAALKKNTWVDNSISTIIMIFISVPSFVGISFMLIWFAYNNRWLPSQWPSQIQAQADPVLAIKAYIIPVAALSFGSIASFARWTRAELTEVMSSEFLLLARTKGLTKPQTVVRHALRNSMVPIVPMIIGEFIGILSGSMVLEQLYGIPGIGSLFVKALTSKDYSVVMVDMAIYTLIGLFATLLVDLSYGVVDPRIRMGARK
jgi:oligopeptide transport system permease protein